MAGLVVVKGVVSCALLTCGQVLAWWLEADKIIGPHLAVCELRDKCRSLHFPAFRWESGPRYRGVYELHIHARLFCPRGGEPF